MTFITFHPMKWLARLIVMALLVALGSTVLPANTASATPISATIISKDCKKTVLSFRSTGKCVKQLQQGLLDAGLTVGPKGANGTFGTGTQAALIKLQKDRKLLVDGYAGPQVWKSLSSTPPAPKPNPVKERCSTTVVHFGTSGDCTKLLQKKLLQRGMWLGPSGADGSAGRITDFAIKRLQKLEGLTSDGYAGPKTWNELLNGKPTISHLTENCFIVGESVCVDKSDQITYAFRDGQLIKMMASRTGGWHKFRDKWMHHDTPNGTFSVLFNIKKDTSSIYDNVPMFNSRYFTWYGHAVHGSESFTEFGNWTTPKGPAGSGGCVNLTLTDSSWLWNKMPHLRRVVVQK